MCGIAGFFEPNRIFKHPSSHHNSAENVWINRLIKMKNSIRHRGPNEEQIELFLHGGFAHTRLAIRDIKGGKQPFTKQYGGIKATIAYNGEIYNTTELKTHLQNYSLSWKTTCDTEVILNGYLAEGPSFFQKLNGIFAFSIYNHQTEELFLVRDPLGVKPLCYTTEDNILVFASEPKALFAYGIKPQASLATWQEIFALGPARTPGFSGFHEIFEVEPGEYIRFSKHQTQRKKYWKLVALPHRDTYAQTVQKIKYLIKDSVRRQMVSDIPICSFLSGGLDSSLVSAICQRELSYQEKTLTTFSFDFVGNQANFQKNDFQTSQDRPFALRMAEHIGSNHHILECDSKTQISCLKKAVDARDFPCMADVESSLLYFCNQVSHTHRVALTGECADEIFGGYPWFHREEFWQNNRFPWSINLDARKELLTDDFVEYLNIEEANERALAQSLSETPRCPGDSPKEAKRREISWLNIRWFMMTLLNRMDRTSMYSGLEARVPFADPRILTYVYNIPWEYKCYQGQTKSLLIEVGKDYLPNEILYRKKSPYPKTYDPNYETMLGNHLQSLLTSTNSPLKGIVDSRKLERFLAAPSNYGHPWYGQLMAGPQMLAYLVQVGYWISKYHISL